MLLSHYKKILLISPHTDDCEFGMGATIANLVNAECSITWVVCSNAVKSLPEGFASDTLIKEQKASAASLGVNADSLIFWDIEVREFPAQRQQILENMVALQRQKGFDAVFCPSQNDWHQDHMTISQETRRAFKSASIFGYDLPWNNFATEQTLLVPVSSQDLNRKMESLDNYESQKGRPYMNRDLVFSIARVRAIPIQADFAEAFEVIRMVG